MNKHQIELIISWKLPLLAFTLWLCGCSTFSKSGPKLPEEVRIVMTGVKGSVTDTRYFSSSRTHTYSDNQLVRDRTESVDFTVRNSVTEVSEAEQTVKYLSQTIAKDGTVSLRELAFPELKEEIEYLVRANGQVLRAGKYHPSSVFFVPSLPIPERLVKVGDTWAMEHLWRSAQEGLPLRLELIGILKDILECDGGQVCVDLEISGAVNIMAAPLSGSTRFESRIWGRILYSLKKGDVVWSEIRSKETMSAKNDRVDVTSCLVSQIQKAKLKLACVPEDKPVLSIVVPK